MSLGPNTAERSLVSGKYINFIKGHTLKDSRNTEYLPDTFPTATTIGLRDSTNTLTMELRDIKA